MIIYEFRSKKNHAETWYLKNWDAIIRVINKYNIAPNECEMTERKVCEL